jgi:transposase
MADYAQGKLRRQRQQLEEALHGFVTDHHRRLLRMLLHQSESLDRDIDELEREIRRRLEPHREVVERLMEIPGFGEITTWTVMAELGLDMNVFGTPERAASWCGLCPGNRKSAGKLCTGVCGRGGTPASHPGGGAIRALFGVRSRARAARKAWRWPEPLSQCFNPANRAAAVPLQNRRFPRRRRRVGRHFHQ